MTECIYAKGHVSSDHWNRRNVKQFSVTQYSLLCNSSFNKIVLIICHNFHSIDCHCYRTVTPHNYTPYTKTHFNFQWNSLRLYNTGLEITRIKCINCVHNFRLKTINSLWKTLYSSFDALGFNNNEKCLSLPLAVSPYRIEARIHNEIP